VLHKGGEVSAASNDICPTSRGFVALLDSSGGDDYSDIKMMKPPSPR
jgi:hypothetical protein